MKKVDIIREEGKKAKEKYDNLYKGYDSYVDYIDDGRLWRATVNNNNDIIISCNNIKDNFLIFCYKNGWSRKDVLKMLKNEKHREQLIEKSKIFLEKEESHFNEYVTLTFLDDEGYLNKKNISTYHLIKMLNKYEKDLCLTDILENLFLTVIHIQYYDEFF